MRPATWVDCAGSCGRKVRTLDGNICRECWSRVPLKLRREWNSARQPCGTFNRGKRAIQEDIQRWIRENPAPPRPADEVPPWRRHNQERGRD